MEDFLYHAKRYLSQGRSVIPLHDKGKEPDFRLPPKSPEGKSTWQPFSFRQPLEAELEKWSTASRGRANVGQVMGEISGVFGIDVDFRNGGDKTWRELSGGKEVVTEKSVSGDGFHLLFKYPGHRFKFQETLQGIDLRSDGSYLVAPPSIHPSGKIYQSEHPWSAAEIPEFLRELMVPTIDLVQGNRIKGRVDINQSLMIFEKCHERRAKYLSDSEYDFAVVVSLVNQGCDFETLHLAFQNNRRFPTHYAKEIRSRGEKRGRDYLDRMYRKALNQPDTQNRLFFHQQACLFRNYVNSLVWKGVAARSDRAALLAHIDVLEKAKRLDVSGLLVWDLGVRELSERAEMSYGTASDVNKRLIKAGWIQLASRSSYTEKTSYSYTLGQILMPLMESDMASSRGCASTTLGPPDALQPSNIPNSFPTFDIALNDECVCSAVHQNKASQTDVQQAGSHQFETYGVFEYRGLGKGGKMLWFALLEGYRTEKELQRRTGLHRTSVTRILRKMEEFSMARKLGGECIPTHDFDFEELGRKLKTSRIAQDRKTSHEDQRESFRNIQQRGVCRKRSRKIPWNKNDESTW